MQIRMKAIQGEQTCNLKNTETNFVIVTPALPHRSYECAQNDLAKRMAA